MRRLLIGLLLLVSTMAAFAQNGVKGRVVEADGTPVMYAAVILDAGKKTEASSGWAIKKNSMEIKHHFIEQGAGFPLILMHGNGEDVSYFVHQMEPFAKHFRVIAIDTRGHGQTPRGEAPFAIRQFAEDLLAFMDQQGIGKAHILGFSDGGNTAMVFAMAHPERVEKLILNGANLDASGVRPGTQLPIEIGYRIARLFARKHPDARKNAELLGLMVNDPRLKPEELAQIHCPTLVIAGEKDMIKEGHTRLIAQSIPGAELVIVPGNHFVANLNPDAYNEAVLRFLL